MKTEKFVFKIKRDIIPEPQDLSIRRFSCHDFIVSTQSFIEHNFEGAMKFESGDSYTGYIHISPRAFAYFIRLLLSEIYGASMATLSVTYSDTQLLLTITGIEKIKSEAKLVDAATRAGFSCVRDESSLVLRTPITLTQEMFVYANDIPELINYYYEVFLM